MVPNMNKCPEKIICRQCSKHLNISELKPFDEFLCPGCGTRIKCPLLFERYYLMELCGIGGMSKVYRAIDPMTNFTVAIKITDENAIDMNSTGEKFRFQVELASALNHPGIVSIYRGGIFQNQPFLVMEFMKKGTLENLQQSFMLPPPQTLLHWLAVIADGLYAANLSGIVHHDVKPANIMLSESGEVKLGDFDLAEINTENNSNDSNEWVSIGFVSPERLIYGKEDHRGDIFSLGATVYNLLTEEYPFGNSGELNELIQRRRDCDFAPVNHLNSTIPAPLSDIITQMLSFEPEKRPTYPEIVTMFESFGQIKYVDDGTIFRPMFHK